MRLIKVVLTILLFLPSAIFGQKKVAFDSKNSLHTASQYQPVDIVFKVPKLPTENPFDITFGAEFTDETNKKLTIQGFYHGNGEYVLRFTPEKIGVFQYQTFSSVNALAGLRGTIKAEKNTNENIHGSIAISSENPQKMIYQDGKPYFALAFELDWLFALDKNNKNELPKTTEIIHSVKENGFNQVVMNVYAYDVGWKVPDNVPSQYSYNKPPYTVFKGTNENPDFSQLNTDFFQHLDRVIQHLHENGIVAHLMIYVWNKKVNWPTMYSAEDNRYFDYVIKRYQAYPNVLWDVSKEALDYGRCDIPYINERIERIRRNDAYKHLLTVHDYEYCAREPDKVDIISIQNWRSDLYSLSLEAYQKHPSKPVMNIEHGGYEEAPYPSFVGNYVNPEVCLTRNYQCVFAGVYSSYYWQNTSWDIVIHDALNGKQSFPTPRFDYYKHLQSLFTKYDYNTLLPYKPKLTINSRIGNDNLSTSGYPLTDGKGLYLYFIPAENYQINVVVPKQSQGKFEAKWFNIFTGETLEEKVTDYQMFKSYQSPWKDKAAVLILKSI
ncbi:DUF5060 domain-containing protein [Flectobacillus sp. DC10W]|uniref:DUF5060 domain-containing protein n=1 Tax=Flectobacillus longus TaxID=2984207 RepID=A0ABT6YL10_9BACT|nr:DUF5060 domain-containing protein [Flectobacillus longus]MDI9864278.1 DUF5060 domain-containing protein [Flectobacillus longus]